MGTGVEDNGEGHTDGFDESEEIGDNDRVMLVDDDGTEVECLVLATIDHEGEEFALLGRIDQIEVEGGDEVEVFVLRTFVDDDGNEVFESIEDEAVYEAVRQQFNLLMDQADASDADGA